MSARCHKGHDLAAVGYRVTNGRVVCLACERINAANYRARHEARLRPAGTPRMQRDGPVSAWERLDYDPAYADPNAPSLEECERKAAVIHALIEDERRQRMGTPLDCVPRAAGA